MDSGSWQEMAKPESGWSQKEKLEWAGGARCMGKADTLFFLYLFIFSMDTITYNILIYI